MNTLTFMVNGNRMKQVCGFSPVSGEKKYSKLKFIFDGEWDGVEKVLVCQYFDPTKRAEPLMVDIKDGVAVADISEELRNQSGVMYVGLYGTDAGGLTIDVPAVGVPVGEGFEFHGSTSTVLLQQILDCFAVITGTFNNILSGDALDDNAIKTRHLEKHAVDTDAIRPGAVNSDVIAEEGIASKNISPYAILNKHLGFGCVGGVNIANRAINDISKFSESFIAQYFGLPVYKRESSGSFGNEYYNELIVPGIYQMDSLAVHQVVVVLRPDNEYQLMQIRLSQGKAEYRSAYAQEPDVFTADDFTEWIELTAPKVNSINIVLDGGSNGTEELKAYVGDTYIGFVTGGAVSPHIFRNFYDSQRKVNTQYTEFCVDNYIKTYVRTSSEDAQGNLVWTNYSLVSAFIDDKGNYYESSDVEGALQEIGERFGFIEDILKSEITSWESLQKIVRAGKASQFLNLGDLLQCEHKRFGTLTWKVIAIDHDVPSDENLKHSVTLMLDTPIPAVQFDAPEAYAKITSRLTAGTPYSASIALSDTSIPIHITPSVDVPVGGCLVYKYTSGDVSAVPMYIYDSLSSTEPIETLYPSSGTSGPSLGSFAVFNDMNRVKNGSSNWAESDVRQYINSDGAIGAVWSPRGNFDRPPEWVATEAGFLNGMDEEFLAVIGEVKKETYYSPEDEIREASEKFFLLSTTEIYAGDYRTNEQREGEIYSFFKENSNLAVESIKNDSSRIVYYKGKAAYSFLRSAHYLNNYEVVYIATTGGANCIAAKSDYDSQSAKLVLSPCCCIC